jgi:hypothetical protein
LSEHLINIQREVGGPSYLQANPFVDLTSVFSAGNTECLENVNVLEDWHSRNACKHISTTLSLAATAMHAIRRNRKA